LTSTHFIGVRIDAVTWAELFERVDEWLANKSARSRHVACLNAYCAALALDDSRLASIYNRADVAGPDGMPFVRWIQAFVRRECDRFYGPDVVVQLATRAKERGYTFYLYGGAPETLEGVARYLESRFPYLRIVGKRSPPFRPLTAEEDREICDEINRLRPDIVCVGLGTPKQDYWIDDHIEKVRGAVLVACGAAFDFFGGRVRMAPHFIQRSGFEWLYRLLGQDFKRLWRRYTIYNAKFLWHFGLQLARLEDRTPAPERRPV
jgi:N-acetylglucosaminyldiphosphoundecaprenol N-acetyl-beta-D-mannosaminyltransferase